MADENRIENVIVWEDTGTEKVARGAAAVRDSVVDATDKINDANAAINGLNDSVSGMPSVPMPTPIPFDTAGVKDANEQIQKVGDSAIDAGKASEMLYSALDSVIPGLGGVVESLFSMNPVAVAGTAIIAGLTLAFAENQRQAEEARKAIEEQVKAEAERARSQLDLNQQVTRALAGDKDAREGLITDLATVNNERIKLDADALNAQKKHSEALQEIERQRLAFEEASRTRDIEGLRAAKDGMVAAQNSADSWAETLKKVNEDIKANNTQLADLREANKKLSLSEEEIAAVRIAETQGVEGTIAALQKLNEEQGKAKDFFGGLVDGIKDGLQNAKDTIVKGATELNAKIAEEQAKKRADAEKSLLEINEKLAGVEADRGKVLADRMIEEQRAGELGKLESRLAAAQAYDAAVARNQKLKEITAQGHAADIAAQQKFMEGQQKLLANYLKAEQNATEDYSRERVRKLEDLYNTLNNLASQRDVAGFVNARRSGMTDIGRGDTDAGIAAQRRRAEYDAAAAEQAAAFAKENAQREQQLQQRLEQERNAGQQQIKQADIVQRQIADLRARYAEQDLRARRTAEDATYQQTVAILQKKRADELKITAGAAAGVIDFIGRIGQEANKLKGLLGQLSAKSLPKFAEGTPYIQRTGLAVVHEGEAVLTAAENARRMRGGGIGGGVNLTLNLSVGEHVSQSELNNAKMEIVNAITSFATNSN